MAKGRVRVMRIKKDGPVQAVQEVRQLNVESMPTGGFAAAFTDHNNAAVVSTDMLGNVVNIVARKNLGLGTGDFCQAVAARFLERYLQFKTVTIAAVETKRTR